MPKAAAAAANSEIDEFKLGPLVDAASAALVVGTEKGKGKKIGRLWIFTSSLLCAFLWAHTGTQLLAASGADDRWGALVFPLVCIYSTCCRPFFAFLCPLCPLALIDFLLHCC